MQQWFDDYVRLMFPDEEEAAGKSQAELDAMAHTARVCACWIVDRLIDQGAHRSLS